ncbi:DUF72 domain-containing protein [Alcanivorax sp. MM125-6]|nr:DUF72 domain-containing protein [Alcanivorax sp. MM125-6]
MAGHLFLLSREGLDAYARHPLFNAVGLDRGFYRPLSVAQYADHAGQVPAAFRFVVKAPSRVTDALARVIAGTVGAGRPAFVTLSNKAEGSAPRSVAALAEAVLAAATRR